MNVIGPVALRCSRTARTVPASSSHEPRVADDIGGEDRGKAAGGGHCSGTPALRMPSKIDSVVALRRPGAYTISRRRAFHSRLRRLPRSRANCAPSVRGIKRVCMLSPLGRNGTLRPAI